MTNEQMWADYEAWASSSAPAPTQRCGEGYVDNIMNYGWDAWQASRASLPKVTLEELVDMLFLATYNREAAKLGADAPFIAVSTSMRENIPLVWEDATTASRALIQKFPFLTGE